MLSKRVLQDLLDKEGRQEFLAARINSRIAYQIRALRNQRGWKQAEFARKLGKPQSNVSTRLENPDYDGHKIGTLREVANAFDMALLVTFVDYGEFLSRTYDLSQEKLEVESFNPKQLELFEVELKAARSGAPQGGAASAAQENNLSLAQDKKGLIDLTNYDQSKSLKEGSQWAQTEANAAAERA